MIQEANLHWRYLDTESNLVMPWYTLPCLQWLKTKPVSEWKVFEYGAGYSTIWWRLNCEVLESIESSKNWADAIGCKHDIDKQNYISSISRTGFWDNVFDCIIVDGDHREECVKYCLPFLKQGAYLIIDNYGSEDYDISKTKDLLKDWECTLHNQPNHSTWVTAVFKKP